MNIPKSKFVKKVEEGHENLKKEMNNIQNEMSAEIPRETFKEWQLEFTWRLRDFRNELLKHFELEEHGGFTEEIIEVAPQYHKRIKQLENEHQEIINTLDTIIEDVKKLRAHEVDQFDGIKNRLHDLLSAINTHEASERELIQDAYLQDFGAAD